MIEQTGQVSRVEDGRAWIACRPAACRACMEGRGCGAGVFAALSGRRESVVCVPGDHAGLRAGDSVVLGLDDRQFLRAAARLYGLPLTGLVGGVLAGAMLAGAAEDWAVLAGAIAGLGIAFYRQRRRDDRYPQPVLLRRGDTPAQRARKTESFIGQSQSRV